MSCVLAQLEYTDRVAKRAQYEAFEFAVEEGAVRVRNCSHEDPSEHEYSVTVTDGRPTECTCPADEHYETACKHRVAVAIREPVLDAATVRAVATDGGTTTERGTGSDPSSNDSACDCDALRDSFPCWECYRAGRAELPD